MKKRKTPAEKHKRGHKEEVDPTKRGSGEMPPCFNLECRLRKQGCRGFQGCPGYKSR